MPSRSLAPLFSLLVALACGRYVAAQSAIDASPFALQEWEFKTVVEGTPKLGFDPADPKLKMIPVLLHAGFDVAAIRAHLGVSESAMADYLGVLLAQKFIVQRGGGYAPAVMVVSNEESAALTEALEPLIAEVTATLEAEADYLRRLAEKSSCLSRFEFPEISLFVLSRTVLGPGQLDAVEVSHLAAERPLHRKQRYYAAYAGKPAGAEFAAWRLHDADATTVGKARVYRYGSARYTADVLARGEEIGAAYGRATNTAGFRYPILDERCAGAVESIAAAFRPTLLYLLESNDYWMRDNYAASAYADEVSYEEYFVWNYHLMVSSVTDRLIAKGVIAVPEEGVSYYLAVK